MLALAEIAAADEILAEVRTVHHSHCRLCGSENPHGLQLKFRMSADGDVIADFACEPDFMGHPDMVHGGVTAAMIDSAMCNCLFVRRITGVTAEFTIRDHMPLQLHQPAVVRARIDKEGKKIFHLSGNVEQAGITIATARAKFMILTDPKIDSERKHAHQSA